MTGPAQPTDPVDEGGIDLTKPDAAAAAAADADAEEAANAERAVDAVEAGLDAVIDARGLRCPLPVIRLARLVRDEPSVRAVTVLATDPAAAHDIPAWCRMRGHDYLGARAGDGHAAYRVGIRPREPEAGP